MTLEEPDRIDVVARSPAGEIVFAIISVRDWSEDDTMVDQLEAKLRNYVASAQSQE